MTRLRSNHTLVGVIIGVILYEFYTRSASSKGSS